MNALAESTGPLQFSLEGRARPARRRGVRNGRVRLATALRRATPLLTRRDVPVTMGGPRAPAAELMLDLPRPSRPSTSPSGPAAPRALVFDAGALSRMLDGVIGPATGAPCPSLNPGPHLACRTPSSRFSVDGVMWAVAEVLASAPALGVDHPRAPTPITRAARAPHRVILRPRRAPDDRPWCWCS